MKLPQREYLYCASVALVVSIYYVIHASMKKRPFFTSSLLMWIALVVLFVATERWDIGYIASALHHAHEFENRFYTFISGFFCMILFFVSDSPLFFVSEYSTIGAFFAVFIAAYYAHKKARDSQRARVAQNNRQNIRGAIPDNYRPAIDLKKEIIRKALAVIDPPFVSGGIYAFFTSFFYIKPYPIYIAENEIFEAFKSCDNEKVLNFLLQEIDMSNLLYKVKDHHEWWWDPRPNRTKLLQLLLESRRVDLNTSSKMTMIMALFSLKLTAHPLANGYLKSLLESSESKDIVDLKLMMDSRLNIQTMHELLYIELKDVKIRNEILANFDKHAKMRQSKDMLGSQNHRNWKKQNPLSWQKIVSDIDDTMYGGTFKPGGCDVSYPHKKIYPGVLGFYRELDLGKEGLDEWPAAKKEGNLAFISARPHIFQDFSESPFYNAVQAGFGQNKMLHCNPSLLAGSMIASTYDSVKSLLWADTFPNMAYQKYKSFQQYASIYPEYKFIFIGDSGQGDIRCAEMLLDLDDKSPDYSDREKYLQVNSIGRDKVEELKKSISRVYIHHVKRSSATSTTTTVNEKCELVDGGVDPIFWSDNLKKSMRRADHIKYGDVEINHRPLVNLGSKRWGCTGTDPLSPVDKGADPSSTYHDKVVFFKTYIEAAIDAYEHDLIKLIGLRRIMEEARCDLGDISDEDWAKVDRDPIYQASYSNFYKKYDGAPRKLKRTALDATEMSKERCIREHNHDLVEGNKLLIAKKEELERYNKDKSISPWPCVPLIFYPQRFKLGAPVRTLLGPGVVLRFDRTCNMYDVALGQSHMNFGLSGCPKRGRYGLLGKGPASKMYCHSAALSPASSVVVGKSVVLNHSSAFNDKTQLPMEPLAFASTPKVLKTSCWTLLRRREGKNAAMRLPQTWSHDKLAAAICLDLKLDFKNAKTNLDEIPPPKEVKNNVELMKGLRGCLFLTKNMGEAIVLNTKKVLRPNVKNGEIEMAAVYLLGLNSIAYIDKKELLQLTTDENVEWKLHINLFLQENTPTPMSTPVQTPGTSPNPKLSHLMPKIVAPLDTTPEETSNRNAHNSNSNSQTVGVDESVILTDDKSAGKSVLRSDNADELPPTFPPFLDS